MAKILVIDDEKQICELLKKCSLVKDMRFWWLWMVNKDYALFYEHHPEIVIADIVIPKRDGFEVISELLHGRKNMAIIAITGGRRDAAIELSLKSGQLASIEGFLLKPFNFTQLLRIIHEITETKNI